MTWKDLFSEICEHVLANSVIAMIGSLTLLGIFSLYLLQDPGNVLGNIVSAIAGAAGGAGITKALIDKSVKNGVQVPPATK
jgi:hypothetical protein